MAKRKRMCVIMRNSQSKVYWITGASSGIGRALAEQLHAAGHRLILSARRAELLEELSKAWPHDGVLVLPLDVSRHDALEAATEKAYQKWGRVDVLVNNAGISQRSYAVDTDYETMRKLIDTNLLGTCWLTRCVLRRMLAAGSGHIVVVSSVAGKLSTPLRSCYCASKQGLEGWFNSLRAEVSPQIAVTVVVPAQVNTMISVNALNGDGSLYNSLDPMQAKAISPERCAQTIIRGMNKRKREIRTGFSPRMRLAVFISKYFPDIFAKVIQRAKVV